MYKELHEILQHFEHIHSAVEYDNGTTGRKITEGERTVSLGCGNRPSACAANLNSLNVFRSCKIKKILQG